ncbi:hypothetical protein L7F22_049945 [Adiantum nelumboides]|nr:hypothetical protein [Adiantum nelumboides]
MEELMSCQLFPEQQCIGAGSTETLSSSLIWACSRNKDLQRGTRIHNKLRQSCLPEKNFSDALVTMYAKCGDLQKAQRKGQNALHYFENMQRKVLFPSAVTYACILKACAAIGKIEKGKQIHFDILRLWLLEHHVKLGNALVDMYAKCGVLRQAEIVLENLPSCNVISWNALLLGYVQNGQGQQALHCFEHMQHEGICPDVVTYLCILKACAMIGAIDKGKQIHDEIIPQGLLENDVGLGGALVDMYAKCGALH